MIGLLGGSFDPVHCAHLAMADAFAVALSLDEVRFVPAARPWQKTGLTTSGEARSAMLAIALERHRPARGRFVVDRCELARGGETYTIDTLADVRGEVGPIEPLVFLFGADQLVHLDTWRDWRRLWDYAHLAVVTRPGFDLGKLPGEVASEWSRRSGDAEALRSAPAGRSFLVEGLLLDVSATGIRAALSAESASDGSNSGGSNSGVSTGHPSVSPERLVPSAVLDYIRANRLYRS